MIFITLGTHEQPFNRLIVEINRLIKEKIITEEVFMQIGYVHNIEPICPYEKFIASEDMNNFMQKARIVVIHGGLGSIIQAFINKKVPIVIPRQKKFGEHVDDHQVIFSKKLSKDKKIIAIYDINELGSKITHYENEIVRLGISGDPSKDIEKRAAIFSEKLDTICNEMFLYRNSTF